MNHQSSKPVISACVLAAGKASRFGASKLTEELRGKPLVQHAILAARNGCDGRIHLVVGHDQLSVIESSAGLVDTVVVNDDYQTGIGSSIAAGVRVCRDDSDAILILLADQPLITASHVANLINTWTVADNEIVTSSFDGITCPPILFPKNAFDALSRLRGDTGAKDLLADNAFTVKQIDFPAAAIDIDTPEDLQVLDQG
jgi:molybdenum cofactor cytidylyltransferase